MPGPSALNEEHCPVRWLNGHALAELPERVDKSNAGQICARLLTVIDYPVLVLLVDMTGTTTCDFACGDALAKVFQRAMARGIELRLIANVDCVLRVLSMCGLDRVVPVRGTVGSALAVTAPAYFPAVLPAPARTRAALPDRPFPAGDTGVEIALLDAEGVIVWVNSAWQAFTAANGGDPAAAGPGVSYLDVCGAAAGDLVTAPGGAGIRRAVDRGPPRSVT